MKYIIKVWLFTIIISPLLIALVLGAIINNSSFNSILNSYEIIFVMIIVGFLSSIPAMVIFWFIKRSIKSKYSNLTEKIILSLYAFLSVWITFFIVDNGFVTRWSEQTIWVLIYSLTIVIGVWIFKNNRIEINE
ncbi:hypothetical protein N7U66_04700 [Lacinutrix neustonica]|uniref:Uncharacterized protein n=1 Tax=Lacinutrix neustonica TaxID=2980107 RepID=A0A9E8SE89_9FLAO|nr:hypothetical protein [Lacinutrix neustonica]WAC02931.1 hypothetical protein N7U66_04700 [Lacinutrix neustonica]